MNLLLKTGLYEWLYSAAWFTVGLVIEAALALRSKHIYSRTCRVYL